jgi:hypothetical protein
MEVFGYEDPSAVFKAMKRVKSRLGDKPYPPLGEVAEKRP